MKKYMFAMLIAFVCGSAHAIVVEGQKTPRFGASEAVGAQIQPAPSQAAQYRGPGPVRP
jgi:hypothetical protein